MLTLLTTLLIRLMNDGGRSRQLDAHHERVYQASHGVARRIGGRRAGCQPPTAR